MRLQILGNRRDPFAGSTCRIGCPASRPRGCRSADGPCQLTPESFDLAGVHCQPVIGLYAGERRRTLDRVQPTHLLVVLAHAAMGGKILLVAHAAGTAREKVGVERNHDVRFVEVIQGVAVTAAGKRGGPCTVAGDWIVLMPLGL